MEDVYYHKDSLEIIKMESEYIEFDYSVLTNFTLVIELDTYEISNKIINNIINLLSGLHINLVIGVYKFEYNLDHIYIQNELYNNKNKIIIVDNKIEIPINLFENFNINDKIGFSLYIFHLLHDNSLTIHINTNKILNHVKNDGYACYFKYNKYSVLNEVFNSELSKMLSNVCIREIVDDKLWFTNTDEINILIQDEIIMESYMLMHIYIPKIKFNDHIQKIEILNDNDVIYEYDNIMNMIKYVKIHKKNDVMTFIKLSAKYLMVGNIIKIFFDNICSDIYVLFYYIVNEYMNVLG